MYIYVSNETPNIDVFFDNLQVTHIRSAILEETHYYPFGLTLAGISSKALNFGKENKYRFNEGTELSSKEFADGSGLELYETPFRRYDAQIGRFHQIDEMAQLDLSSSPYVFANNNPILLNDPLGLKADTAWKPLEEVVVSNEKELDTKNGQVLPSRNWFYNFLAGNRIWGGYGNHPLLINKFEVDYRGYILKPVSRQLTFPIDASRSPIVTFKQVIKLKNFIKARYLIYTGRKTVYGQKLLYIGKAKDALKKRYTVAEIEKLGAVAIEGLDNLPSNAVALGVEQLIIDLNGGIGNVANKINATVKEIYINEARGWLDATMPNWEQLLKFQ